MTRQLPRASLGWSLVALAAAALIAVPFWLFEASLAGAIEAFVQAPPDRALLAAGLGLLLAADVFLPVPSSLLATASGMLLGLTPGALTTWSGLQAGVLLGYGFGRSAGRRVAQRLVGEAELARAADAHQVWGGLSLLLARAVPVLAESSVLLAGLARMPLPRFALLTGASNAALALVYASVGAYAVETRTFLWAFAASTLGPGLLLVADRLLRERRSAARRERRAARGRER